MIYLFVPIPRPYNFRRKCTLQRRRVNSARHGTESILFLGPKIWDPVLSDIKLSQYLRFFKRKIKKWVLLQCQCQLSKIFLQHVGFIQWTPVKLTAHEWRRSFECFFDQCANKFLFVCQSVHIVSRNFLGKILSPVQWQSWRQLALCYYCRGYTKIFCV